LHRLEDLEDAECGCGRAPREDSELYREDGVDVEEGCDRWIERLFREVQIESFLRDEGCGEACA